MQRTAQDSRRDEVCDPHSTTERKDVDVGDVGERRLQENKCSPVTRIGSRYEGTHSRNITVGRVYRNIAVGKLYRNIKLGTLYRNITVAILYRNIKVGIFYRNITIGTLVDMEGNSAGSEVT